MKVVEHAINYSIIACFLFVCLFVCFFFKYAREYVSKFVKFKFYKENSNKNLMFTFTHVVQLAGLNSKNFSYNLRQRSNSRSCLKIERYEYRDRAA